MSPGRAAAVDLARVRFYADEQLAGVGLGLMALRSDVVVASHPPIADFPRDDPDWIPEVAARGWVVITDDKPAWGRQSVVHRCHNQGHEQQRRTFRGAALLGSRSSPPP